MPKANVNLGGRKKISAIGPKDADIVIVGDAPGAAEEKKGKPFVGSSGRLLNQMLDKVGIKRHRCYITNVIKTRPPKNNFKVFYNKSTPTEELLTARKNLREEIKEVNPNITIALGKEAIRAVMDDNSLSIMQWRGSVVDSPVGKVIGTYHPARILRIYQENPIVLFDLKKAKKESYYPEVKKKERKFFTGPSKSEVLSFLRECKKADKLSFDIETKELPNEDWFIDCLGLAPADDYGMCIPFTSGGGESYWSIHDEIEILLALADLLADKSVKKIAQNAQYDIMFLEFNRDIPVNNLWFDTMNASKVVYPEFPKSLAFLTSIYTDIPYYKDTSTEERWIYNAKDSIGTFEVAEGLVRDLNEISTEHSDYDTLYDFYRSHIHPMLEMYIKVQQYGVKIDRETFEKVKSQVEKDIEDMRKELKERIGMEINVNPSNSLQEYLYEVLGAKKRTTEKGNLRTDEDTLLKIRKEEQADEINLILDLRKKRDVKSSYFDINLDDDFRMRCTYNVSGTKTGRLSSSKTHDNKGMNLQNVEKTYRGILVPDDGFVFLGADLSQAENRVVAYLCEDKKMMEVVESGGDIHTNNAAMIFNKLPDQVTKDEREMGKRITHGCLKPDAEVLTLDGWKRIEDMEDNEVIAQADPTGKGNKINFINAEKVTLDFEGEMRRIKTTAVDIAMTPKHRIPYKTRKSNPLKEVRAGESFEKSMKLITNGTLDGISSYSVEEVRLARLAVAIQADATCRSGNTMEFHLKNQRKVKRLKRLTKGELDIKEGKQGDFSVKVRKEDFPLIERFISWDKSKTFKWSIMHESKELKEAVVDEVTRWDGNKGSEGVAERYSTTHRENAEIIQTLCHGIGKQALWNEKINREGNRKDLYLLTINNRSLSHVNTGEVTKEDYKGKVYCVKVPSSYFLVRTNNTISVTGNSNYMMGNRTFAKHAGVTVAKAKELLKKYHDTYPRVRLWHKSVEEKVRRDRTLINPFGRKRYFNDRMNHSLFREAVAYIPQSTVGDCLHRATLEIYAKMPHPGRFMMNLHDEMFAQVPNEEEWIEHGSKIIKIALERPFTINGHEISIPTEVNVGSNWKDVS